MGKKGIEIKVKCFGDIYLYWHVVHNEVNYWPWCKFNEDRDFFYLNDIFSSPTEMPFVHTSLLAAVEGTEKGKKYSSIIWKMLGFDITLFWLLLAFNTFDFSFLIKIMSFVSFDMIQKYSFQLYGKSITSVNYNYWAQFLRDTRPSSSVFDIISSHFSPGLCHPHLWLWLTHYIHILSKL